MLEKAGYRASKKKSEFFMKQTKWLGHEIDENGINPNEENLEAILKVNPPENTKELKSFSEQYNKWLNFYQNFRKEQTDYGNSWKRMKHENGEPNKTKTSEKKQMLTEGPCLAHYEKIRIIYRKKISIGELNC